MFGMSCPFAAKVSMHFYIVASILTDVQLAIGGGLNLRLVLGGTCGIILEVGHLGVGHVLLP